MNGKKLVTMVGAILLTVGAAGFLVACDDDKKVYDNNSDAYLLFYNLCAAETAVGVWVDGESQCVNLASGDAGCLVTVEDGIHTYWATGLSHNWGTPTDPITVDLDRRETKQVEFKCD